MAENIEHYRNQISLARTEIKKLRHQLIALKHEHQKDVKLMKTALSKLRCSNCSETATTIINHVKDDNSASTSEAGQLVSFRYIGVIESTFQNKRGMPRQPSVLAAARGIIIIDPAVFNNPEHALSGLEEFSHMWVIFHFHATESTKVPAKVSPPRLSGERRGVFSTRSPHRPCPIGLSLVKIQSIEGNKIYFLGVDMVNGTPVLDIKPYIPQYDYPNVFGDTPISSMVRPPTEGISDAADTMASLQLDDNNFDMRSVSSRLSNPIGIETNSPLSQSPFEDDIPSPENPQSNLMTPISPSSDSPSSVDMLEGRSFRTRSPITRPDRERGAPDGQERFTPPQSAHLLNIAHDGIRVAPWISDPPSQTYEVRFTDDALERLNELIGDRAPAFKTNIESLLSEDPRSQYVRNRYPDHEYSCVLEDLAVSCVFDGTSSICTIIAIRTAEELQQN